MMFKGTEFIHMMQGEMSYRIGEARYDLQSSDFVTFDGVMRHCPQNVTTQSARFLTVTSTQGRYFF